MAMFMGMVCRMLSGKNKAEYSAEENFKEKEMKKIFGLTTAVLLSMIVTGGGALWAQNLPGGIFASPQSDASQGRLRSNADDFIRPDFYTNVKFEKWFGMGSYGSTGRATAGLATKVGGLYLGAFYNGNFWTGDPSANDYTERELDNFWTAGEWKTYKVFAEPSVTPGPVNNFAVLLGVADMGFRLTYRTNYQSFNKSDVVINLAGNPTLMKSYKAEEGYVIPQVAWAMAKDLSTSIGVRPYVTFDLDFRRNNTKYESFTSATDTSGEIVENSSNYVQPTIVAGLGGVTFINKDGFKGSADIEYTLSWRAYSNEYNYTDANGKLAIAKIKGVNAGGQNGLTTNSYTQNIITPSVSGAWNSGNVGLRFRLNLPVTITGTEEADMAIKNGNTSGELVKNGAWEKSTAFAFQPDLRLAMSWRVVPKLALYFGGQLRTTAISLTTTDRNTYSQDEEAAPHTATKTKANNFGGTFTNNLRLGTTFNITDNVWLEAQTGVWNSDGRASVFGTGTNGLFEFSSLLVGLKF
jgi:hypothetical protein